MTPAKVGLVFSPSSRSVTVGPSQTGMNFTAAPAPAPPPPRNAVTMRVSVSSGGTPGNADSRSPAISADGRYVAFVSDATNLVPGDTNNFCDRNGDSLYNENCPDVFVHDRRTALTERVSLSSSEAQANGGSSYPAVSADGRYVAFASTAGNLVTGDSNGYEDVFVRDRLAGQTERLSVSSSEVQANGASTSPAMSADGRYVAFAAHASNLVSGDDNGCVDVFVRDRQTGQTERVSVKSGGLQVRYPLLLCFSEFPSLSADGRYVAFQSAAADLVPDDTNNTLDVFVHDRVTRRPAGFFASNGAQGNAYPRARPSRDGRYVTFSSARPPGERRQPMAGTMSSSTTGKRARRPVRP